MIEGIDADYLLADRGYDSDAIVTQAQAQGITAVIPPRKNRKHIREHDKALYRLRHLVENAFLYLKRWRGVATRYVNLVMTLSKSIKKRFDIYKVAKMIQLKNLPPKNL